MKKVGTGTLKSGHLARAAHMVVGAVAQAVVVALAPREHGAGAGEADGELGAALHLHRPQPSQAVHLWFTQGCALRKVGKKKKPRFCHWTCFYSIR